VQYVKKIKKKTTRAICQKNKKKQRVQICNTTGDWSILRREEQRGCYHLIDDSTSFTLLTVGQVKRVTTA
jgi:hypothetical protein